MIACPSKTLFSRFLPSGVGVRSIIAGMRPFAALVMLGDIEEKGAELTIYLQVPLLFLGVLRNINMCRLILNSQLFESD